MPIFRWGHTWEPIRDLEREVDRLLQSVNLTFQGIRFGRPFPAVNLYELEHEFLLTAELPGTRPGEMELTISGGLLTLKGERTDPEQVPPESIRRHERPRGKWQRSLSIPDRVREDQLTAEFSNGLLKVHLPKSEGHAPRRIPVTNGDEESPQGDA